MADDSIVDDAMMLDPTLKKKKKKKKALDLDGDDDAAVPEVAVEAAAAPAPADADDNLDDLLLKKKKKKKKVAIDDDDVADVTEVPGADMDAELSSLPQKKKKKKKAIDVAEDDEAGDAGDAGEVPIGEDGTEFNADEPEDDEELFAKTKKKHRKRIELDDEDDEDDLMDITSSRGAEAWIGTDRDYTYQELLERAFGIMREKNPDHEAGEKRRFVMKPPQVVRIGTKKCAFVNFTEICKLLHRQPDHLLAYILAELGTSGSVDGNNQLVIRGRFQQKQMENVLRRYIREYVTCHTCRSPDTMLSKENRLFFLHCESCNSRCSVAAIKAGYQAVTTKRAATRTG